MLEAQRREARCWGFIKTQSSSPRADTWKSMPKISVLCPLMTLLPMLFAHSGLGPYLKQGLNWICFGITWEKNVNLWISNFCYLKVLGWCWAWGKWDQGGLNGFIPSYTRSKIWPSYQYGKEILDQPHKLCKAGAVPLVSAVFHHLVSELDLTWCFQVSNRNVTNTREVKTIVKKKKS